MQQKSLKSPASVLLETHLFFMSSSAVFYIDFMHIELIKKYAT